MQTRNMKLRKYFCLATYMKMCSVFANKSRMVTQVMKFSFHHRAFYCYLGMSVWIFFLIAVVYKYVLVDVETTTPKKIIATEYISPSNVKFRRIFMEVCNPPDNIIRGSEAAVDSDTWMLQGVLVLTRHGDRGPLTHLRGGDKLPCDVTPESPLLKSYVEYVRNASAGGRAPWVQAAGPFHNFPTLPARGSAGGTRCALGQLTATGVLQMLRVGAILRDAYAEKLGLSDSGESSDVKRESNEVVSYSTRYRRTFQSLAGVLWGLGPRAMSVRAAAARESHSVAFCFRDCACAAHHTLFTKINSLAKNRLKNNPPMKALVNTLSKVIFESRENSDPDVLKDALLAYMCHSAPLPCPEKPKTEEMSHKTKKLLSNSQKTPLDFMKRSLLDADIDALNMELDYINNQLDFNNEIGRKARDIIGKYYDSKDKQKAPLDFDAQMEREKLLYYQQRYMDNAEGYEDVVIVKKNLDADFNFPNDARIDPEFDEEYTEVIDDVNDDVCVKRTHLISLFAYTAWTYRQEVKNAYNRRRGLLLAYGLLHNIVQNMIHMISENKPKLVIYSGHDKTLEALILALGLKDFKHYSVVYASRMIFEVYRKRELRDEFKFTKRKAIAQDFYFRVVYNGEDVTNRLSFCRSQHNIVMKVVHPIDDMKIYNTYLCPIENIVRFIHDDYFTVFNVSNFKDACASYSTGKGK